MASVAEGGVGVGEAAQVLLGVEMVAALERGRMDKARASRARGGGCTG